MKKIMMNLKRIIVSSAVVITLGITGVSSSQAQIVYTGYARILSEVDVYLNDEKYADVSACYVGYNASMNSINLGETLSFRLELMPDADNIAKQNNISVVSYLCSTFLKNEEGAYDVVEEKTIESTEIYKYKLDKAGQYKFSFEEIHDGSRTNNKIDFSIKVGLDKNDKNIDTTNVPTETVVVNNSDDSKNISDKITINSVKVKSNKITGKVSVKGATVKVKVGKKVYKKAKVKKYRFSYSLKNVKKGAKIKVKVIKGKKISTKTYKYN